MLRTLLAFFVAVAVVSALQANEPNRQRNRRPNVILIMTDDQGFGDLGFHGNPVIRTPNLDKFAAGSVRMKNFYVCPVCSPTRSSLLTGRYNYRTGVVDTFIGRSMMRPDEVTLAELLAAVGYQTGIFGKWHLGDNYPMRPNDQGFTEALVHRGGGIGQPSDPPVPGGNSYFNPILQHNGKEVKTKGYCSDVYTDAAIDFIGKHKTQPFFVYLPFNPPHTPLQVPQKYLDMYKNLDLSPKAFPKVGQPIQGKVSQDDTARVYGMVTNIDDNLGRLFAKLKEWNLEEDTIVIFLTDNGPQQARFNGGLRGRKGSVYEGGTRVPFFVRWKGKLPENKDVPHIAAHIDIVPTICDACSVPLPKDRKIDGKSLLPLWKGQEIAWPERSLFFQWHRGDEPELYRAFAVRTPDWRLVQASGVAPGKNFKRQFQLFNIAKDPYEMHDVAADHPQVVARLKQQYANWFQDVGKPHGYAPPRIVLGNPKDNPSMLTKQDWRGPNSGWSPKSLGFWEVKIDEPATYDIKVLLPPKTAGTVHFQLKDIHLKEAIDKSTDVAHFNNVRLPAGPAQLNAWIEQNNQRRGVLYVEVTRK